MDRFYKSFHAWPRPAQAGPAPSAGARSALPPLRAARALPRRATPQPTTPGRVGEWDCLAVPKHSSRRRQIVVHQRIPGLLASPAHCVPRDWHPRAGQDPLARTRGLSERSRRDRLTVDTGRSVDRQAGREAQMMKPPGPAYRHQASPEKLALPQTTRQTESRRADVPGPLRPLEICRARRRGPIRIARRAIVPRIGRT